LNNIVIENSIKSKPQNLGKLGCTFGIVGSPESEGF
jgi:hypothetical protein